MMNNLNGQIGQIMTPEKQRIAIAQACGIARLWSTALPERTVHCDVPDYLNDLNAMHEAEKVLVPSSEYTLSSYMFELSKIVIPAGSTRRGLISEYIFHATAAQRAEAFLRTIGKWEES